MNEPNTENQYVATPDQAAEVPFVVERIAEIEAELARYKALAGKLAELLKVFACPDNCIGGAYHGHYGEPIQCQFCYERGAAIAEYDCSMEEQQEVGK